jgi:hypothetical protein
LSFCLSLVDSFFVVSSLLLIILSLAYVFIR